MQSVINRCRRLVCTRPGLLILAALLLAISVGMIKPDFYLTGWDNFSSYLNPGNNLFNTFFATWREHRGLGVPSDAENNDLPRQLFSAILSPIVGLKLVDQIYFVLMLWGGTISMYVLGRYVSRRLRQNTGKQEFFGFLAAFFYLFNLSTLSVFYFPMIMYVTRYFMLPATILILLKLIDNRVRSRKRIALYLAALFGGFGAFMVPTIFIVFMMMFGLLLFIFPKTKRLILILALFIGLNSYWILPFANYTIQKGAIVPSAPTFIEINAAMLNKPKEYYSFEHQAKLRPSFFESEFHNNATNELMPFHPLAGTDETGATRWLLWIFPTLYLLGIGYTVLFKRDKLLVLFALTTVTFLLLSMKEYSPIGLIYSFITDHVPFASTIFRFGDTKFHAMIALGGSIMSALILVELIGASKRLIHNKILKALPYILLCGLLVTQMFVFKSYFNGNMIGFFMYNHIPDAYFDMATIINNDPEPIRVIQLPFDNHTYWKPYSWGYFGSAFLHFMINKPIFDRSFEPASTENADLHAQLMDTINLTAGVPDDGLLENRAQNIYETFRALSIKYVIDDGTVTTNIDARNIAYWGDVDATQSHRIIAYLAENGFLKPVQSYTIDGDDFAKNYQKLYPYNPPSTHDYQPRTINLYEVRDPAPRIEFLSSVDAVHSGQDLLLTPMLNQSRDHYVQSPQYDAQSIIYPFTVKNARQEINNQDLTITMPFLLDAGSYRMVAPAEMDQQTYLVKVYLEKTAGTYQAYLEYVLLPEITGAKGSGQKTGISFDIAQGEGFTHIVLGDTILPIADIPEHQMEYIGAAMVHDTSIPVRLLSLVDTLDVSHNLVQREENPQCLGDSLGDDVTHITGDNGVLTITGQNVSNCLTTAVTAPTVGEPIAYIQLEFTSSGERTSIAPEKSLDTGKPVLEHVVKSNMNPLIMSACVKPEDSSVCANNEQLYNIPVKPNRFVVPMTGDFSPISTYHITFTVRSSQLQQYATTTTDIVLKRFSGTNPFVLHLDEPEHYSYSFTSPVSQRLQLTIPVAASPFTQTLNLSTDGILIGRDDTCAEPDKDHAVKENENGILSYAVGCRNFINKNILFSSSNFYSWIVDYKHLAGEVPQMVLNDKVHTYYDQQLNPPGVNPNDYFAIPLQNPELPFTHADTIAQKIEQATLYNVSGFIEPRYDLVDHKNKEFIIQHYSQNAGLIEVQDMSLIELPNYWAKIRIVPEDYQPAQFDVLQNISFKRILPSLWKVTMTAPAEGDYMLKFNEGFDSQWIAINAQILSHIKCDGFANCYLVHLTAGDHTMYLFYLPEVLHFSGWIITILSGIAFIFIGKKYQ